jgi:hypothetical protein
MESWPIRTFGTWREVIRAVIIVVFVAALIGGATSPGQQYLPDAIRSLANAVGPWFVAILLAVYAGRSRVGLAIVLGVVGFVLLNVSYGVVSESRGFAYSAGLSNIWTLLALPAGVIVGVAATWLRSNRVSLMAIGAATPAAVLLGEGMFGLTVILDTTGPVVWILELAVGAAFLVVFSVARLRRFRPIALCVGLAVGGALVLYFGLQLLSAALTF